MVPVRDWAAIDPGVRGIGLALFRDSELAEAYYVSGCPFEDENWLDLWSDFRVSQVWIERPEVYPGRQKGDPNDLISLGIVAGAVWAALHPTCKPEFVFPRRWKGRVSKEETTARTRAELTAVELENVALPRAAALGHNVWDAIGLGLWVAGRIEGPTATPRSPTRG